MVPLYHDNMPFPGMFRYLSIYRSIYIYSGLTIPASSETSIENAKTAAARPVIIVLLTGTRVCLFMSQKNGGSSPSLAIAIKIRGCETTAYV